MKPVKGLSSLFSRSLSPTSASMKENASNPSTKNGNCDDTTPRKEPRDLESFLLRLPLSQVSTNAPPSALTEAFISPSKARRFSLGWKYGTITLLSLSVLLLCTHSLSRHTLFLRRLMMPTGPTRHMPIAVSSDQNDAIAEEQGHVMRAYEAAAAACPPLPKVAYGSNSSNSSSTSGDSVARHYPYPKRYRREECQCVPVHNFVILSMQRSGSGWFETLLNSHPNISSHGEVFVKNHRRRNVTIMMKRLDSVYNLDWVSSAAKNECTSAVGLKWMLNQGVIEYHPQVLRYLHKRQVSIVLLLRRNVLRRLVSILANAHDRKMRGDEHRAHTHDSEEARKLAEFRPNLNTRHLQANLQRVQETVEEALEIFNSTRLKLVYYEDVLQNRTILQDVQRFLGVPVRPLSSLHVKIHTKPFRDTIENYDQVAAALNGTVFQKYLEEEDDSKIVQ